MALTAQVVALGGVSGLGNYSEEVGRGEQPLCMIVSCTEWNRPSVSVRYIQRNVAMLAHNGIYNE